jgi:hypothetical protein
LQAPLWLKLMIAELLFFKDLYPTAWAASFQGQILSYNIVVCSLLSRKICAF